MSKIGRIAFASLTIYKVNKLVEFMRANNWGGTDPTTIAAIKILTELQNIPDIDAVPNNQLIKMVEEIAFKEYDAIELMQTETKGSH